MMEGNVMRWLKWMVAGCFLAVALTGEEVILSPQDVLMAGVETTLWGVLSNERQYDRELSQLWEEQNDDLPVLEEREVCTYVWEYECVDGVTLDDGWPQGLVRPLVDSWHLFDRQCFQLADGRREGKVAVRLRYWDDAGKEWVAMRQMTVMTLPEWSSHKGVDIRRRIGVIHGLHYLQRRQQADGFWWDGGDECYRAATTGCALWAFGNHGYGLANQKDNPFFSCVEAGVRRLAWLGDVWPLGGSGRSHDGNRNGRAVRLGEGWENSNYVHPICLCGMMAAGRADYEVELSGEIGQFGGMPPGSPIPCTLGELVGDGIDYILMQLSVSGKTSWAYNYMYGTDGYDLSIAGWNYLALLAGEGWGIDVDESSRLKFQSFLETVYHDDLQYFTYTPSKQSFHTESLDASGLMGLLLMSCRGMGDDNLQRLGGSGVGSALLDGTNQLFDWVRRASGRSVGYSWWSVAKGFGLTGVNSKLIDGRLFDWRYGWADGTDGGWRKILECQESDGRWTIEEEA
ncbi:MAG: hypothetical protein IKS67_06445, partial [Victivallales bacterium]|nr:hypothetical protein [Victivallales bacterium]